jgi:Abortive infection C-terminus
MAGLTNPQIMKIVNRFIGVSGGYLGNFSYRTHAEFYPEYCNLDIDPGKYQGTTRETFIEILKTSPPNIQAKIVNGVLERFTLSDKHKPNTRTQELYDELSIIASELESTVTVTSPNLQTSSEVVERAIQDLEVLVQTNGALSGVDRIHTTFHGYLRAVCKKEGITHRDDDTITSLWKLLRNSHPNLQNLGTRTQNIDTILRSFSSVIDALNPIRNHASIAHPNSELLQKDEAILVINATRTLLTYLNSKFM